MHPLLFHFGNVAIPTYGALVAIALVSGLAVLVYFARRLDVDPNRVWNLGLIGILTALIATRLLLVAEYFSAFREHPFWVLGLSAGHNWWAMYAGGLIGFAAATLYALAEGLPLMRVLDCMAAAAALALGVAGIGAFVAGVDFGLPVVGGWGVIYTSPLTAFWYHTPLGVRLFPVQLYWALACFAIFGGLGWWLPRRRQDGELVGAWLFLTGVAAFFLSLYAAGRGSEILFHQLLFALMVVAGAVFLIRRKPGRYTEVDDPSRI